MDASLGQERVLESYFLGLFGDVTAGSSAPRLSADNSALSARISQAPGQASEPERSILPPRDSTVQVKGRNLYSSDSVGQYIHLQPITVAGVQWVVPKECIVGLLAWPNHIEPPALAQPGVMGYARGAEMEYTLIDLDVLLGSASGSRDGAPAEEKHYQYAVLVGNGCYALACECVDEDIILNAASITWRKERRSRSWLAGTLTQFGYLLLDVDELVAIEGK